MPSENSLAPVDRWIRDLVRGRDFADVGGLWGITNEKILCAARANARSLTMIDITAPESPLWADFRAHCSNGGVDDCQCISADVHGNAVQGAFDVVHCNGLLYHTPQPLHTMLNLRRLCRGSLLLGSAVIPSKVSNQHGTVSCDPAAALFVPAMTAPQRDVMSEHFRQVGAKTMNGLETSWRWEELTYDAWWWLFTIEHIEGLLAVAGFVVRDIQPGWSGRSAHIWADVA